MGLPKTEANDSYMLVVMVVIVKRDDHPPNMNSFKCFCSKSIHGISMLITCALNICFASRYEHTMEITMHLLHRIMARIFHGHLIYS